MAADLAGLAKDDKTQLVRFSKSSEAHTAP